MGADIAMISFAVWIMCRYIRYFADTYSGCDLG